VTAREGDQDWSWLRYSHAFRFSSTLAQTPFGSIGQPPSSTWSSSTSAAASGRTTSDWRCPRKAPAMVGGKWRVSRPDVDRSGIGFSSISVSLLPKVGVNETWWARSTCENLLYRCWCVPAKGTRLQPRRRGE